MGLMEVPPLSFFLSLCFCLVWPVLSQCLPFFFPFFLFLLLLKNQQTKQTNKRYWSDSGAGNAYVGAASPYWATREAQTLEKMVNLQKRQLVSSRKVCLFAFLPFVLCLSHVSPSFLVKRRTCHLCARLRRRARLP